MHASLDIVESPIKQAAPSSHTHVPSGFFEIFRRHMPGSEEDSITTFMFRSIGYMAMRNITKIEGDLSFLCSDKPYVLVANHNQRMEAIYIPGIFALLRRGYPLHFLADWNFMVAPIVASMYRHAQVILVSRKDIKPKFLNVLKPVFTHPVPPFERALKALENGAPVGVYPEGTINRDAKRLMRGSPGAAKLALDARVPVLPVGVRFPNHNPDKPIPDGATMSLHVGDAIPCPTWTGSSPSRSQILAHHETVMNAIAQLSGKSWTPKANKRRRYVT